MAVADVSLQKAVHNKWTHYIGHYVGQDTGMASGLMDSSKVEFIPVLHLYVILIELQAWDTVVNYMKLPSITEPLREFSE